MQKKTIILIGGILGIAVLGVVLALFFRGDSGESPQKTFDDFLPFGNLDQGDLDSSLGGSSGNSETIGTIKDTGTASSSEKAAFVPQLRQLSAVPTAGAVALRKTITGESGEEKEVVVARFMERATGHVYETQVETLRNERLTNTTIPKVYEALWGDGGESVIVRYLNDDGITIESFSAHIVKEEEDANEGILEGEFLQSGIEEIGLSPGRTDVFYLVPNENGVTGVTSNIDGSGKAQIFDFPFTEWIVQWAANKKIFLTTKASNGIPGYVYTLSAAGGSLERVLGGIPGLTTLANKTGNKVLYSASTGNGLSVSVYDTDKDESTTLGITTLPEKCAWGSNDVTVYCGVPENLPQGEYPDVWYQGRLLFADTVWRVDTETGYSEVLNKPSETAGVRMDIIKPFFDEEEGYFFFTNKNDSALWALKIKE